MAEHGIPQADAVHRGSTAVLGVGQYRRRRQALPRILLCDDGNRGTEQHANHDAQSEAVHPHAICPPCLRAFVVSLLVSLRLRQPLLRHRPPRRISRRLRQRATKQPGRLVGHVASVSLIASAASAASVASKRVPTRCARHPRPHAICRGWPRHFQAAHSPRAPVRCADRAPPAGGGAARPARLPVRHAVVPRRCARSAVRRAYLAFRRRSRARRRRSAPAPARSGSVMANSLRRMPAPPAAASSRRCTSSTARGVLRCGNPSIGQVAIQFGQLRPMQRERRLAPARAAPRGAARAPMVRARSLANSDNGRARSCGSVTTSSDRRDAGCSAADSGSGGAGRRRRAISTAPAATSSASTGAAHSTRVSRVERRAQADEIAVARHHPGDHLLVACRRRRRAGG